MLRVLFTIICVCSIQPILANTSIVNSSASISISFDSSVSYADSLEATAIVCSLFNEPLENNSYTFRKQNDTLYCTIPVETTRTLAGVIVGKPNQRLTIGTAELTPGMELKLRGYIADDGLLHYRASDNKGFNAFDHAGTPDNLTIALAGIFIDFASYKIGDNDDEPDITAQDYADWKKFEASMDSLFHVQYRSAVQNKQIPDFIRKTLDNNLKYFFAANWRFNYAERAGRTFGLDIEVNKFPAEYFRFLNDIDFSDEILNFTSSFGPYFIFKKMLTKLDIGHPIGETPISVWKQSALIGLENYMERPTPLLLEMLAASSFVTQINDGSPLNDIQIKNIRDGFSTELASLILKRNAALTSRLGSKFELINLTDSSASAREIVDKFFPDSPVIIDLWNAWCTPCREAFGKIDSLNLHPEIIPSIYISDTSSDEDSWRKIASQIGGIHVRISETNMSDILKKHNICGFPGYIFLNRQHDVSALFTGFPGTDIFYNSAIKASEK